MATKTPTVTVAGALKVSAAIAGLGLAFYFLPMLELMELFFWIVVIPMAVLAAAGVITTSTFNTAVNFLPTIIEDLEKRIDEMNKAEEAA